MRSGPWALGRAPSNFLGHLAHSTSLGLPRPAFSQLRQLGAETLGAAARGLSLFAAAAPLLLLGLPTSPIQGMKFIAAYLLAVLSGKPSPSAEDLSAILESVGCEIDNEKVELLLSQLSGKDITELIAAGREKFASVPCGGGVAVAAASPAAGGAGAAPAAEAKKEEKVEEKEESDDDMGFSLFD
ncbi:hypothetical protein ACP4OV_015359 [Aristida adscensionis]